MATSTRRPPTRRSTTSRNSTTRNSTGRSSSTRARTTSTTPTAARTRSSSATRSRSSSASRRPEIEVVRGGPTAESMLVCSVGVLCLLGLVMVYSASSVASVQGGGPSWQVVTRQFMFMSAGLLLAVGAARIPLRVWRDRLSAPLLLVAIALQGLLALDVVMKAAGGPGIPFAISVNGATRWLGVGVMRGQPSDVAKLALILWLAKLLDVRSRDIGSPDLLKPVLAVTGLLGAFIMAGDDMGTTLLIGVIMLTMLFLAGAPVRHVGGIAAAGLATAVLALFALEGFRLQRISAFLSPDEHIATEGWQLLQSQIGFASGGLWGNGPGNSRAKWGYLPEADTDFILAVIGEELGLIGSLIVLGAFVVFMLAGIRIALRTDDRFGRLVAFGITTWIGVQALINIGVTVGTLPTKGITLPFVSYGGSSLMMCMLAVGVLMSVARAR
ncbi:MAG: putative lipid II flippase FtsW [Actinomycetota bacterium]|nr:putative lipid II flippase FtsW [Actinomycetota bacterium]